MGSIDGYTWIRETWSPQQQQWEQTAAGSDVVSLRQLRRTVADFNADGESRLQHAPTPTPQRPTSGRGTGIDGQAREALTRRLAERQAQLDSGVDEPASAMPTPARAGVGAHR